MPPDEQIFTVTELSEHLRVHPTTIYRLLRRGLIPGFRVGSTWRFSRAAIEEWEHGRGLAQAMAGFGSASAWSKEGGEARGNRLAASSSDGMRVKFTSGKSGVMKLGR